jgi:hypothetical protein
MTHNQRGDQMQPPTRGQRVEPLSRSEPPATSPESSTEMPIMRFLGIQVRVPAPPGVYRAILEATPDTLNSNGAVHGAALATLIDGSRIRRDAARLVAGDAGQGSRAPGSAAW